MTDPTSWSFPLGRIAGITVRVHLLLVVFILGMMLRGLNATPSYAFDMFVLMGMLFISVLLHEFGHCFAARAVGGDADEVLLWPLGGLAMTQTPNVPRAHFIVAAAGPLVNVLLCVATFGALCAFGLLPPVSPFWSSLYLKNGVWLGEPLYSWFQGGPRDLTLAETLLARFFHLNWILFWFNVLLVGFPLDGGRMLQAVLWPRLGLSQATRVVVICGYGVALVLGLVAFVFISKDNAESSFLLLGLALFIYLSCKQQLMLLESGALENDSLFGYDFSQGYTSFERSQPTARGPKKSFWQAWKERRAEQRRQREEEEFVAEQQRMDELLVKIQEHGRASLTPEENRFLTRVAQKIRNKQRSEG